MISQSDKTLLTEILPFWNDLTEAQKNLICSNALIRHYNKGQSVFNSEYECIGVLIVKSGTLRSFMTSDEGREITLYELEQHDICILSASCIMRNIDFDISMDAETECETLQISASAFSSISAENIHVELFSYKLAAERFSDVMWAMHQLLFTSLDKRLASFLMEESIKTKSDTFRITHEQIAKHLGTAREVISRLLKDFSVKGIVTLQRGGISIIDKEKLRDTLKNGVTK